MKVVHPGKPGQGVGCRAHRMIGKTSRMKLHKNARLTPQGRRLMVRRIEEQDWKGWRCGSGGRAVCPPPPHHWLGRDRAGGERMLCDRSSPPAPPLAASTTSAPDPAPRAPTARPSASSRPACANGPTPAPITPPPTDPRHAALDRRLQPQPTTLSPRRHLTRCATEQRAWLRHLALLIGMAGLGAETEIMVRDQAGRPDRRRRCGIVWRIRGLGQGLFRRGVSRHLRLRKTRRDPQRLHLQRRMDVLRQARRLVPLRRHVR